MNKILAIDTSGQQACAAIVATGNNQYIVIGEISLNARTGEKSWTHSEILMPAVDQLLNLTGVNMQELDYIAYTCGPGSFTGLRIGASTALGLGRGLNKPTIPVPTLDALAYNMLGITKGMVVPMMDARRGQVYSAVYENADGKLTRTTEYLALPVKEVAEHCTNENVYLLGDGACAYKEEIKNILPQGIFVPANNNRQRASSIAICAAHMLEKGFVADENVEILYIRAPQAVQDLKNKHLA